MSLASGCRNLHQHSASETQVCAHENDHTMAYALVHFRCVMLLQQIHFGKDVHVRQLQQHHG